jgi:DNA-binding GntR family transcriptional regulator
MKVTMEVPITTSERVYTELRQMVSSGELAPGERLVQRKLAERLGVSSIPVIEATRRLQHDGLVVSHPNFGAQVREWTNQDVEGAYLAREALEGICCRLFVQRANDEQRARLVALAKEFDDQVANDNPLGWLETDMELHKHIVATTKSQPLAHMADASFLISVTMRNAYRRRTDGKPIVPFRGVHDELVAALLGSDPDGAEEIARAHIRRAYARMLEENTAG